VVEFGPGVSSLAIAGAGFEIQSYGTDELWLKLLRCDFGDRVRFAWLPPGKLPEVEELPFIPGGCGLVMETAQGRWNHDF
jgi:hypothetical protein